MRPSGMLVIAALGLLLPGLPTTAAAAAGREYAVFKSADRGRSWVRSDTGLPGGSRVNAFGSVDGVLLAGTDAGIFVSADGAESWQAVPGGSTPAGRVVSFATLGQRVFAGTDGDGIWISSSRGRSWVRDEVFPVKRVRCLAADEGTLYAGTDAEGVFVSDDGGRVWSELRPGLPVDAQVFALSMLEGRLYAALYSKGLYGWDEPERRWRKAGSVIPLVLAASDGTLIAGHNPGGVYWSGDLGTSWSRGMADVVGPFTEAFPGGSGALPTEAPVWELAAGEGLVLAGAATGIYYSEDRGRSWIRARTGLPEKSPGVAFLVARAFVLAATWVDAETSER